MESNWRYWCWLYGFNDTPYYLFARNPLPPGTQLGITNSLDGIWYSKWQVSAGGQLPVWLYDLPTYGLPFPYGEDVFPD